MKNKQSVFKSYGYNLALVCFILLALISLIQGFHNAIMDGGGSDMQWSPSKLLLSGINPYQYWLAGNVDKQIIYYQVPNYLHALYLVMLPLAMLKWTLAKTIWAIINFIFGILSVLMLTRGENLKGRQQLFIALLFLCSTPFRNSMGLGQQSIFILFFVVLSFYSVKNINYILSTSLAITKYSFAPPLLFYEYLKNGFTRIYSIIAFSLLSVIVMAVITKGNPIHIIIEPLLVSRVGSDYGIGDIMSLCYIFLPKQYWVVSYILPVIFSWCTVSSYFKNKNHNCLILDIAFISLVSLASFKHHGYDYVFLLPLLVAHKFFDKKCRYFIYTVIFWFWFGAKVLYMLKISTVFLHYDIPFNLLLNLFCIGIVGSYSKNMRLSYQKPI